MIPSPGQAASAASSSGERVSCVAIGLISECDGVVDGDEFGLESGLEKWRGDSAATFHMSGSKECMSDMRISNDKVRIGDTHLLDVECVGTVTVVFPSETGDVTLRIEDVAYVPDLGFNLFSLIAAHQNKMYYRPEEDEITLSLLDGRLRFPFDGASYSKLGYRIDSNDVIPLSVETSPMMEVEQVTRDSSGYTPMAIPVLAPGNAVPPTTTDINDFHCLHGHASSFVLKETAKRLGVELHGELKPCTGCSMAKGYRKPIKSRTNTRSDKKLGRVFVDLSGPKSVPSLTGKRYVMIVKDDYSRYSWLYFLERKSDAAEYFRKFLADVRADGVPSTVESVRSDNGGEFYGGEFASVCRQFCIKQEFTTAKSPEFNGVAERGLGIIDKAALAARIQAPLIFPHVRLPPTDSLWAEAMHSACDALNHTATIANPNMKSPYELWHGSAAPASPHPFLRPGYCRWNRPSKSFPRAESCFYLGPGIDHPRDSLRMLTRANKVVETRDVTWEAPAAEDVEPPTIPVPESPEMGGEKEPTEESLNFAPPSPLPFVGRGIPHQRRTASPEPQATATGAEPSDTSSASSDEDTESTSSDGSAPTPTPVRTAARQLGTHIPGPRDGDEIREGRTRAQTRVLQESATGLLSMLGPDEGGRVVNALVAEQVEQSDGLPKCTIQEAEPEPTSYAAACASKDAEVWKKSMDAEFAGLVAAGTFTEVSSVPEGCNIVDSRWVFKWKGDVHGVIERAKSRMVCKGYSQVEGVDFFEVYAPTASSASNRLLASLACLLDLDLRHFDVEQAFVQSDLDAEIYLRLPPGCGSMSGKVVRLNKSVYGLKQASRTWYQLLVSTLEEIGFEQCLVDPCVLRLLVGSIVVAMVVIHVDDIQIAASQEVAEVVVDSLNDKFPTKNLGELSWYMGSEYKRDREKGTLEISQAQFIANVLNRFNVTKTSPIPASPSLDLRHISEDETVVDVPFREVVGSLMWIANQTRPDIANAVRAVARFSHDPKEIHWKAACKILEYLKATAHLGLTYRRDDDVDIEVVFELDAYVDADYAQKANDRCSVSGAAIFYGGALVTWFSRTQKSVTLSTTEAEYVAMAEGVKEAMYVRGVLEFLRPEIETPSISVFEDNRGAKALAENPLSSSNSKHIDVRHHFLRELVKKGEITVNDVSSKDQRADILTKALDRESFETHRNFLVGLRE